MNNKKIAVYILLFLTVVIAGIAIFLASTLGPKPDTKIIVSQTPKISIFAPSTSVTAKVTISPTISNITVTITKTPVINVACGLACDKVLCSTGNTCMTVNGSKKCVSLNCVTQQKEGGYLPNGQCDADLCSRSNSISITKTGTVSCVTDQNNRKLKILIKLTNPVGNTTERKILSVIDQLNTNLKDSYIITSSISDGGKLENGKIIWQNLVLSANGGSKELNYEALIPITDKGKDYSNTILVLENGTTRGSSNFTYPVDILPCTALITDEVDRIIIGLFMFILGVYIYKNSLHYKIGQKFWKFGGKNLVETIHEKYLSFIHEEKGNFERRLLRKKPK